MGTRLIISEDSVYEIDEDCLCELERQKKEQSLGSRSEKKRTSGNGFENRGRGHK